MDAPIIALSRTAQWHELISQQDVNINSILLKNVPFILIEKIEFFVENSMVNSMWNGKFK